MSRSRLIEMVRHSIGHAKAGTLEQEPEVFRVPASNYFDVDRWRREMDAVFRRVPLVLATTAELREPGRYKALTVLGVPVLIARAPDGALRAFVNMCSHRGAVIMPQGAGRARRFICPYHAWAYDEEGALVGILSARDFGEVDRSCLGLTALPVAERAGLVWVHLDPKATLDIDTFLCGYGEMLDHFGFADWHVVSQRQVEGPNWKIAYDGYLDLYHLPILHKDTFGPDFPNQAHYYAWGPHQRVSSPHPGLVALDDRPEAEWPDAVLMAGVWTIFPHVSIATFDAGGPGVLLSQLFPGETPQESVTVQTYLMREEPDDEQRALALKQVDLLEYVVREEDYATGLRQQAALRTGVLDEVIFGRNEGGGHRFHRWLDRLLDAGDDELPAIFAAGEEAIRPR
jgi:phenylpropionate dioxygenase-like ring-hydroxylating dioxygenase large terminal subunit